MRRPLPPILGLAALALATAALAAPPDPMHDPPPPGYYAFQRVVYQNDRRGPDAKTYFGQRLRNLQNPLAAVGGKAEIRVVSFGEGVELV